MPNSGSCSAYFSATGRSAARVLVACGVMSGSSTSHSTSMSSPPRIGSGHENTGCSTQSELEPGAWFVLEPSKPQIGSSAPSARILVLDRSRGRGLGAVDPDVLGLVCHGRGRFQRPISRSLPLCERCVNWGREPRSACETVRRGTPPGLRAAHGRGARCPAHPAVVHRRAGPAKSIAITPAELENAFDEGMSFDGSSIDGFTPRAGERRARCARPGTFELLPWADGSAPVGPHVLRHPEPRRHTVRRRSAPRAQAQPRRRPRPRASRSTPPPRSSSSTSPTATRRAAPAPRPRLLLRPHHRRRRPRPAQAHAAHPRGHGHPRRVLVPRGRARASTRSTCATPTR